MRSLSRKQVRVGGPWAFESPRFRSLAAIVKWSRRRALNPEAGVRLPVAVRNDIDARWSRGTDVRLLPGRREFDPLPGSATPGGRGSGARLQTATRG